MEIDLYGDSLVFYKLRISMGGSPHNGSLEFHLQGSQDHGIKKSIAQTDLVTLFRTKTKISKRNTRVAMIFLTPKQGYGNVTTNMEYDFKNCHHSFFQKLECEDLLAKTVVTKCKELWGEGS
eukprot:scaffold6436_cov52-Attheya_sp.AAC.2